MPENDKVYLLHIIDEINFLLDKLKNLTFLEFLNDDVLKRASVRSIEVIGEAVKNISTEIKERYPDINWRAIAAMRNKLIHEYFGIDYDIVWETVQNRVPELKIQIEAIIKDLSMKNNLSDMENFY